MAEHPFNKVKKRIVAKSSSGFSIGEKSGFNYLKGCEVRFNFSKNSSHRCSKMTGVLKRGASLGLKISKGTFEIIANDQ